MHFPVEAQRPFTSMGLHGTVFFIASNDLDGHWINAAILSRPRTPGVSGGEWNCGLDSAGPDTEIQHDDWRIRRKANHVLIDSYLEL